MKMIGRVLVVILALPAAVGWSNSCCSPYACLFATFYKWVIAAFLPLDETPCATP